MDAKRFDTLTTRFAGLSRRHSLGLLAGLGLGAGVSFAEDVAGKRKKKPCQPCVGRKKGKCKRPLPDGTTCAGGTCQGGVCIPACAGVTCTKGQVCKDGACVNGTLADLDACAPQLPLACASGKCGCRIINDDPVCFCRLATCGPDKAPCTSNIECCRGVCRSGVAGFRCSLL